MDIQVGLFFLPPDQGLRMLKNAKDQGWKTFHLAEPTVDQKSFFDLVRRHLPLDPDLKSHKSWDALSDSLWEGLSQLPDKSLVVLWENSHTLKAAQPQTYLLALEIWKELITSLSSFQHTAGATKQVSVVVS